MFGDAHQSTNLDTQGARIPAFQVELSDFTWHGDRKKKCGKDFPHLSPHPHIIHAIFHHHFPHVPQIFLHFPQIFPHFPQMFPHSSWPFFLAGITVVVPWWPSWRQGHLGPEVPWSPLWASVSNGKHRWLCWRWPKPTLWRLGVPSYRWILGIFLQWKWREKCRDAGWNMVKWEIGHELDIFDMK